MKQPAYTAGVTGMYRKYLDFLFEKGPANYHVTEKDKKYLLDLFNRGGSCTGYYHNITDFCRSLFCNSLNPLVSHISPVFS